MPGSRQGEAILAPRRRVVVGLWASLRDPAAILVLLLWSSLGIDTLVAQETAPQPAPSNAKAPPRNDAPPKSNAALQQEIEALQERINVLQSAVAARDTNIVLWQAALTSVQAELVETQRRLDELEQLVPSIEATRGLAERLAVVEEEAKRVPELPPDVVSAGNFPGSIRIPRTNSAIKFGGRVRFSGVFTLGPLGSEDRFLTHSIPVEGSTEAVKGPRTNFSARASRFNVDLRTPTDIGDIRAYIEGDFAGTDNGFRMRHAYGQYSGFILGQTWSTFSDPAADHQDLDFEGVSSQNFIRQPQIRYTWQAGEFVRIAVAAETPQVSISGGAGVNLVPDLVGRAVWSRNVDSHLQLATVIRQIRGEAEVPAGVKDSAPAAGGGVSGVVPLHVGGLSDRIIFQLNGGFGTARYINDLNSLGGQDAVVDTTTGELHPLPVLGWYVDYEHTWKRWETGRRFNLRSSVIWSWVGVDNHEIQPGDSYKSTNRIAANIIFSPGPQIDVGIEYIWGTRQNKDGASGSSDQIQLVTSFMF